MKYLIIFISILSHSLDLFACDTKVEGFVLKANPVMIRLSDGKMTSFVIDDDGFMIITMAAAYCRTAHPLPTMALTPKQTKCLQDTYAKNKIEPKDQLDFTVDRFEDRAKKKTIQAVWDDCRMNHQGLWDLAYHLHRQAPLTCGKEMKPLIANAVAQSEAFYKDTISPAGRARLTGTAADQEAYIAEVKKAMEFTQEFGKLIDLEKPTVWDFDKWLAGLEPRAAEKGYQVLETTDGKQSAQKAYSLIDILKKINPPFDFIRSQTKCSEPFKNETVTTLKGATWRPGSGVSAPAATETKAVTK